MLVEVHVLMHEASTPLLRHKRKYSVLYLAAEAVSRPPCARSGASQSLSYLQLQHQQYHITQNVFYLERVHVVSAETIGEKQKSEERC